MDSIKVICCPHTMEDFYKLIKEFINDTNIDFNYDCETYGNHAICFCICYPCFENLKSGTNLSAVNSYWLKFCSHSENLKSLSLNAEMRFFKYYEVFHQLPLKWYGRLNLFTKKKTINL